MTSKSVLKLFIQKYLISAKKSNMRIGIPNGINIKLLKSLSFAFSTLFKFLILSSTPMMYANGIRPRETTINITLRTHTNVIYYAFITNSLILSNYGVPVLIDKQTGTKGIYKMLIGGIALKKAPKLSSYIISSLEDKILLRYNPVEPLSKAP